MHARYYWLLPAEEHLNRRRFGALLGRLNSPPCAMVPQNPTLPRRADDYFQTTCAPKEI
jgi:hypothetical protein